MAQLTAVSLFSGCGGFDWGAKQAGVKIIWANDKDPYAAACVTGRINRLVFKLATLTATKRPPRA